jgi:hypothetical protein
VIQLNNLVDVLINKCKEKIEREMGVPCDDATAWKELDRIFKVAQINNSNKFKILDNCVNRPTYRISRGNAIALGIAFGFKIEEMNAFLSKAAYCLSDCHDIDKLIINHLTKTKGKSTLWEINRKLDDKNFPTLDSRKFR